MTGKRETEGGRHISCNLVVRECELLSRPPGEPDTFATLASVRRRGQVAGRGSSRREREYSPEAEEGRGRDGVDWRGKRRRRGDSKMRTGPRGGPVGDSGEADTS
eukprot:755854-Prorocentrum_minimum.AAC.6